MARGSAAGSCSADIGSGSAGPSGMPLESPGMPHSERLAHRTWNLPSRPFDASWGDLGLRHDAILAGRWSSLGSEANRNNRPAGLCGLR
jgi:hypothetical protein